ncbi:MAG: TIGR03086 family metal-binding protein [Propionibacteriaceae bacterium]
MSIRDFFPGAAHEVTGVVRRIDTEDLTRPTPCTDFALRELINHFIGTTAALARVGRREALDSEDPYGASQNPSAGDWQTQLATNLDQLASVWAESQAWEGTVDMGGGDMPATMIGEMALAEILLHGWDLARASDQRLTVSDEVGKELLRSIEETGELGRQMGAYGPEVAVDEKAGAFERALAASGRDPGWSPNTAG